MDRALPEFNTILHKKWNQQNKRLHKKKINQCVASVDNNLPTAVKYPINKAKKELLIECKSQISFFVTFLDRAM